MMTAIEYERRKAVLMTVSRDHDTNRIGMAILNDSRLTEDEDKVACDTFLEWAESVGL
jgi:hypothetical protein